MARPEPGPTTRRPKTCAHDSLYWYPAINEEGWKCVDCGLRPGEPAGFSPAHDRSHTKVKCACVLHDLADANLLSVSNGSEGDALAARAAKRCTETGRYDQHSIVMFLADLVANDGRFWRETSEGILAGKDPRKRCACGALATSYSISNGVSRAFCSTCSSREPW